MYIIQIFRGYSVENFSLMKSVGIQIGYLKIYNRILEYLIGILNYIKKSSDIQPGFYYTLKSVKI